MTGMLASSKAGHDKKTVYVIIKEETEYVYLADGRLKTLEKPKKKKRKHIQIQYTIPENLREKLSRKESIRNEDIKFAIKLHSSRELRK